MATRDARIYRRAEAYKSLVKHAETLAKKVGVPVSNLTVKSRYKDMEDIMRIEAIADFLAMLADNMPDTELEDYSVWTVDQLTDRAQEIGIYDDIEGTGSNGSILKSDLVAALEGA